jgi:glycosyltransferase involved in cell wall biosynthesis
MTNYFQKGNEERFEKWLHVLSSSTDGAICVSNGTKNIYKQWYADNISTDLNKFKILVSHNGADIDSSNPSRGLAKNTTQVLDKIKKKVSFISVGTLEPRKGHVQTLKAFEKLWNEGFEISLVFVGKIGWNVDNLVESLRNHSELNKRLFWLEGISDEYLQKVYEVSDCLIASSEGEGFGLPLIEAAQKKLPIIARDIPIFREVAGEFAYYFLNDNNPDILAQSIKKWLELYQAKTHPKSDEMPWLTWEDSTKQLLQCLGIK